MIPTHKLGRCFLCVCCVLVRCVWEFAGDIHVHPQRYLYIYIYIYIYFFNYRSQNNTLGRGTPAALRPPWRPSVPVPTCRLFYAFLTYLSRLCRWQAMTTSNTASSRRATTTTTTTRADIFYWTRCSREKNLLIPAAAGSFSLDATLGLLATRRRLGSRGDSSAMRSACVVSSCML